jgi:hypothetical protein
VDQTTDVVWPVMIPPPSLETAPDIGHHDEGGARILVVTSSTIAAQGSQQDMLPQYRGGLSHRLMSCNRDFTNTEPFFQPLDSLRH